MRYIDADALKDNFCDACATLKRYKRTVEGCRNNIDSYGNRCFKMRLIDTTPTADVVPKSEVEKQKHKQDVMLLDAIDTFRNLLCIESYVDYEDTRKHYVVNIDDVNRIHAELKKKYTEVSNDN